MKQSAIEILIKMKYILGMVYNMKKEHYNYWLANLNNIGAVKISALLEVFKNSEEIYYASEDEIVKRLNGNLKTLGKLKSKDIDTLIRNKDKKTIKSKYNKMIDNGIHFVCRADEYYPSRLKNIYGPPFALYYRGNLPKEESKSLAIVGARNCSQYGREMGKHFASALAREGIAVVSGLARGIDTYAHQGALLAGGETYSIMGCGVDICYPRENINIFMDIIKTGGVISEYPPGMAPLAGHFPMRNRIISGLSDGVLVIEAKEKSGSLITVDMGLEQGKDIFTIPGRVTDRLSEGCNNLIKMGAKAVTSPKEILEDLLPNHHKKMGQSKKNINILEQKENIVYANLSLEPRHIEEISMDINLPLDELMEHLLKLELCGLARQTLKNYYVSVEN